MTNTSTKYITKDFVIFSFSVEKNVLEFLRQFIAFKRLTPQQYHYNQSDAVREGIKLLRTRYDTLVSRPISAKIPTRGGKSIGFRQSAANKPEKVTTSFHLSLADREFIYDVIYNNTKDGTMFTKEKFMQEIITALKEHYPMHASAH